MRRQFAIAAMFGTLLCSAALAQTNPPQILSLVATQRLGTMFVDITYDLVDPDNQGAYILVECSANGGSTYGVPIYALSGDVNFVTPGSGKRIVWNAWTDWAGNYTPNARIRLTADASFKGVVQTTTNPPPATNLVWIPSGSFSTPPGRNVYISRGFWMGRFEVTQGEFVALMTNNPSRFTGSTNQPVEQVTWNEAVLYCQRLTEREQAAGRLPTGWSYRLPTEAEWEYACRAGTTTTYFFGDNYNRLTFYAWMAKNSGASTHDVGGRAPNRWGLFDMNGNVSELCSDWAERLAPGNVTDPQRGGQCCGNGEKITRGGQYIDQESYGYLYSRRSTVFFDSWQDFLRTVGTDDRYPGVGFRVVLAENP